MSWDRLAIGEALKRVSLGYFQQVDTGNILNSITTGLHTLENMGIRMVDSFIGGYLNFLYIFLCLLAVSPLAALVSLAGTALSFLFLLLVSRHSAVNAPVSAQAGRDLTAATLEYARGLPAVKSFGQGGASMAAMRKAIREAAHSSGAVPDLPVEPFHDIVGAGSGTIFSDMVCCLLSKWCVATSFYQRAANLVFFCTTLYLIQYREQRPYPYCFF